MRIKITFEGEIEYTSLRDFARNSGAGLKDMVELIEALAKHGSFRGSFGIAKEFTIERVE